MKENKIALAAAIAATLTLGGCSSDEGSGLEVPRGTTIVGEGDDDGEGGAMSEGGSGGMMTEGDAGGMMTGGGAGGMGAGGAGGMMTGGAGGMMTGGAGGMMAGGAGGMGAGGDSGAPFSAVECGLLAPGDAGADAGGAGIGTVVFCDDFEAGASNWNLIQRVWAIQTDDSAVYQSENDGAGEARTVSNAPTLTDMTITGRVKVTEMNAGRRVYLAGRFIDSNNWYGAALHNAGGGRTVQIRKKVAGSSSDIGNPSVFPFVDGTWYDIRFQIAGTQLTMSVDGVQLVSVTDESFTEGGVALLADQSVVSWDDIVVTTP